MSDPFTELHLVVPCTAGKRNTGQQPLCLPDPSGMDYVALAERWFVAVNSEEGNKRLPAELLYRGAAWVKNLAAAKFCDQLWVMSAGFGVISSTTCLPAYNLTFSAGSDASLPRLRGCTALQAAERWWKALEEVQGNEISQPGGLIGVMERNPQARFLITGSRSYLALVAQQLNRALAEKRLSAEQFILLSSWRAAAPAGDRTVQFSAPLAAFLGCNLVSLNASVAHWLIDQQVAFDTGIMQQLLDEQTPPPAAVRKKIMRLNDDQVLEKIHQILLDFPGSSGSVSSALRLFRHHYGLSCEQKRFTILYKQLMSD